QKDQTIAKVIDTKNNGYGSACNLGAKNAKAKVLCFANPDTTITQGALEILLRTIEKENVGVCGPCLKTKDGENEPWSMGKDRSPWETIQNNIGIKKNKKPWENTQTKTTDWVSGAFLVTKKELFEKINGFDENLFLYFEDVDYCKRIRQRTNKIILHTPEAIVTHQGGTSMPDKQKKKKYYKQAQDYYFKKHYGQIQSTLFKVLRACTRLLRQKQTPLK
ncbi:MAG: glycosyltransferase, partial [Candidatus Moranbacteria bacterium]|nr:glycosyltransferase [Candidatus Moranbacteria bacterium]